jgi:2-keto-4-pentenoate hydratase
MNKAEQVAWAEQIENAARQGVPKPCLADKQPLSTEDAYRILQCRAELRSADRIIGFKGALTNESAQATFRAAEPVIGLLFDSAEFKKGMIETELGFRLTKRITEPLRAVDQLQAVIDEMALMVELVDLDFAQFPPTLADLIVHNAAAKSFIRGQSKPFAEFTNQSQLRLEESGICLQEGTASEVLGDQRQGLMWMINTAMTLGYRLDAGLWLMTGSVGSVSLLRPGRYGLFCDGFETLTFEVV